VSAPGLEAPIYALPNSRCESRVVVALDYPALTEEIEGVALGPDPRYWAYSWIGGSNPQWFFDRVVFRSFGVPPYEWIRTRENWVPDDPTQPFKWEFGLEFPAEDPVYSPVVVVGGLTQQLADLGEPLVIYHHGSATSRATAMGDTDEGKVHFIVGGFEDTLDPDGDGEYHVVVEWDPERAVNATKFRLQVNEVEIVASDDVPRPEYVQFGMPWSPQVEMAVAGVEGDYIQPAGTAASPVTIMIVHYCRATQLGSQGFESRDYPDWVFSDGDPDHVDLETAEPGELFTHNSETCVIVPPRFVREITWSRGTEGAEDRASVTFTDDLLNGIAAQRWLGRSLYIDTRVVSPSGDATAWKRQAAIYIDDMEPHLTATEARVKVSGPAQPHARLGVYQARYWRGASTSLPGVNTGYTMAEIWQDIIEVADATYGAPNGFGQYQIQPFDLLPSDVGTLGESLLPVLAGLVDECAHEMYIDYPFVESYGRIRIHAGTLGSGTADYTLLRVTEARVPESIRNAPGQAHYRQNLPVSDTNGYYNLRGLPMPGAFPFAPMPSRGRVLNDTVSFSTNLQATAIQTLRDKDGATIPGGIAQHRYRLEATRRRILEARCVGQDYIEPSDEIEVEGALGVHEGETFVVAQMSCTLAEGELLTLLSCRTSDWERAVRRAA